MRLAAALLLTALTAACANGSAGASASSGAGGMVAAANPMATEAGLKILREGGSAVDAAVAVQAVLGLVEPQSSGLAGGAFMVHYDAETGEVTAYDGRETAPSAAGPEYFFQDGRPRGFSAMKTGLSTGAPGVVAMLAAAHEDHGSLPWNVLFGEAERLARDGFPVPGRMAAAAGGRSGLDVQAYVGGAGQGDVLRNLAYADTVALIAAEGPDAFYEGPIAEVIAARVAAAPDAGALTAADIAAYEPRVSDAICRSYRVWTVCAPPAPSGGPGVLMALGIYENLPIDEFGPDDAEAWYLFAEGQRVMYADRDQYIADPAFVDVPTAGLLDPDYLASRAALIGAQSHTYAAGDPPRAPAAGADATAEAAGTSHFVIVDAAGDVVSMTTSVETSFGSGRMAGGMVLNNQLTDFSQAPVDAEGRPIANAVAPGKRPRSSMAPVIVLDQDGAFFMAVGSPGGNSIPAYNLKVLVGVLDWDLSLQEAIDLPNLIARGASTQAEVDKFAPGVVEGLAARGIEFRGSGGEGSGLHGVMATEDGLVGAADPRREGTAGTP